MEATRVRHWQEAWHRAGLATGQRVPSRGKFYAVNAYPGPSGFLHVGTVRGLLYTDALHRYHRMLGESVLFPFGIHASGLPAVTFAQRVQNRDPVILQQLEDNGVPASERERLENPEYVVRFLGESYRSVLRSIGVLFDETTFLTTIDEDYRAFIRWQFRALERAKVLVRGTYTSSVCPVCGPVAVDPSETDLSAGGDAELLRFATVPFRLDDGRILLAATLRPETVYGVTNLWLAPGETLVVWHEGDHAFIVARPGAERLVEQHGGHLGHEVPASELIGREVEVPLRKTKVPILESALVTPEVGTGVVMSVPAHAPADEAALRGLPGSVRTTIEAPPILLKIPSRVTLTASETELTAGSGTPAERALRATGAASLADTAALEEATERLYRLEFARGEMTVPALAGVPVREARTRVVEMLTEEGPTFELQEFSKPVICRNGHAVIIRKVPDQWFLAYGDPDWKERTREAASRLVTWPTDYGRELSGIIDWFTDRPCTRKGRWLGTPFPLDPEWVIEPIADSTFYMAYFIVRRFVSTGRLSLPQLTDAFFDYVFLGEGPGEPTVDRKLLEEVRAEFLYLVPARLQHRREGAQAGPLPRLPLHSRPAPAAGAPAPGDLRQRLDHRSEWREGLEEGGFEQGRPYPSVRNGPRDVGRGRAPTLLRDRGVPVAGPDVGPDPGRLGRRPSRGGRAAHPRGRGRLRRSSRARCVARLGDAPRRRRGPEGLRGHRPPLRGGAHVRRHSLSSSPVLRAGRGPRRGHVPGRPRLGSHAGSADTASCRGAGRGEVRGPGRGGAVPWR